MCHGFYFNQTALITCRAGVARELRHRIASVAVLVLLHTHTRDDLALDDVLCICNRHLLHGNAAAQFYRLFPQCTRNGKLIVTERCCRRLETGTDLNRRINTDTDGNRKCLSQFLRAVCHCADVACARGEENRKLVFSLNAETVNRHIMQSGVRMGGVAHAERDVRAGIIRRIRRRRDETVQIKIGIGRQMYHFLAWRRALKFNRCNRLFYAVIQHFSKTLRLAVQQGSHAFPACQNTNRNAGVRVPFYVAKNHRRAFFRRTLYGPARTDVTVNTGKLRHRINLNVCLGKLSRHISQSFQRTTQISYFFSHSSSPFILSTAPRRMPFHPHFLPLL